MKIIKPSVTILKHNDINPQKYIESIARVCYKSEDLITENSHKKMIKALYGNKHFAMLEHFIFIYEMPSDIYFRLISNLDTTDDFRFIRMSRVRGLNYISFSARSIIEWHGKYYNNEFIAPILRSLIRQVVYDYNCPELFNNEYEGKWTSSFIAVDTDSLDTNFKLYFTNHLWLSAKFICDRGISHELVRHRDASFAQESTRYCNYSKDKFGNELTFIKPKFYDGREEEYKIWEESVKSSEESYFKLINSGSSPQEARTVLPNSLKTEIVVTARYDEWVNSILKLRCAPDAHPQMREVMDTLKCNMCIEDSILNELIHGGI